MSSSGPRRNKNSETPDTYMSEGMTIGVILGIFVFFACMIAGHTSYGATGLLICIVGGMLFGMMIKKPQPHTRPSDEEVKKYKELDREHTAFLNVKNLETHSYNPMMKKPMLRTNLANGEKVAGFYNCGNGRFEPVMLIRNEKDLAEFIRRYQIKDPSEITEETGDLFGADSRH